MLGLFRLETGGRSWNRLHGHLSSQSDSTSGLAGWDADDVRTWPLVTGDPVVDARESEWQREWARTHDPDGLARYYSQYQRQAPPRQVPPRQRQSYVPPQQRVSYRPAGYADARGFDPHVPPSPHVLPQHAPHSHGGMPGRLRHGQSAIGQHNAAMWVFNPNGINAPSRSPSR